MRTSARRIVVLSLMGASAFALSACKEDQVNASIHANPQACQSAGYSAETCAAEFAAAQQTHTETAPRYDALAVCEEQHGVGQCQEAQASGGGGSSFMPFLMGYMVGNMLSGSSSPSALNSRVAPKPLYPVATGGYATADGAIKTQSLAGSANNVRASAFNKPSATQHVAPMTRASVSSKGGFGASRSSFGG